MAAQTREQNTAVIEDLLNNPRNYAFAQAIRLLRLHAGPQTGVVEFLHKAISVVPELSLGYPGADIVSVRELPPRPKDDSARYEIVATFLALYGSSCPLPTFYTEELLEEARSDASASRDFLNIFNNALYELYYRAFNRYKLGLRVMEQRDKSLLNLQYSLLGYGDEASRRASGFGFEDLRFINLFSPHARSAQGLRLCLRLGLGLARVEIEECVPCAVPVPERQLCRLGKPSSALGEAVLGRSVPEWRVSSESTSTISTPRAWPASPPAAKGTPALPSLSATILTCRCAMILCCTPRRTPLLRPRSVPRQEAGSASTPS